MRLPILIASLSLAISAPASAQSQPYRIFFDWGKPDITRDGQGILDQVVADYQQSRPSRVYVAAHTDRSGSSNYNMAASKRRAKAVMDYLVAKGVPAEAIMLSAFGEGQPFIPTEDGVREVQNRRAEITFEGGVSAAGSPLIKGDGSAAGTVSVSGNNLTIEAEGLPPGVHGLHVHAVGRCDGPDFASAGPHWNPAGRKHGAENPEGHHQGDLPNLTIGEDGRGSAGVVIPDGFDDADGAAIVVHAGPDDYRTDPSGNSGARIACAVLKR